MLQRLQWIQPFFSLRLFAERECGLRRYLMRFLPSDFQLWATQRLLDFGCGSGNVVSMANSLGLDAIGVEPDSLARSAARAKGAAVVETLNEAGKEFDRVVLSHVLEHLPDPVATLLTLRDCLTANGRILIRVPNAQSAQAATYGPFWIGYDMPRHLWHFCSDTLRRLLAISGLEVVRLTTIELPTFARRSAEQMEAAGVTPVHYEYRQFRRLEQTGRGTELLVVARRN